MCKDVFARAHMFKNTQVRGCMCSWVCEGVRVRGCACAKVRLRAYAGKRHYTLILPLSNDAVKTNGPLFLFLLFLSFLFRVVYKWPSAATPVTPGGASGNAARRRRRSCGSAASASAPPPGNYHRKSIRIGICLRGARASARFHYDRIRAVFPDGISQTESETERIISVGCRTFLHSIIINQELKN